MKAFEINGDTVSLALFIDVTNSKYASFSFLNFPFVSWDKKWLMGYLNVQTFEANFSFIPVIFG